MDRQVAGCYCSHWLGRIYIPRTDYSGIGWKYQRDATAGKSWLFNMKTDPTEQNNLVEQQPERVKTMQTLLDKHNAEQKEPAWPNLLEAVIRVDKPLNAPVEKGDEYIYVAN